MVLAGRSLRWSSPLLFNDPFDVPREMVYGVTGTEILEACGRRIASLIENPPADTSELGSKLRLIVERVKAGIPAALKEELIAENRKPHSASHTSPALEEFKAQWRDWLPTFRILCLTESPMHTAMWLHYADKYRGAVLEFACVDELDSAWLAAERVVYSSTKPAVYTADGWAELLSLQHEIAVKRLLYVATYIKSPDWSYEAEWRIATFRRPGDAGTYTDYKFDAQELVGVYLGPLMSDPDRGAIMTLLAAYPSAKVFSVRSGMTREFVVEPITRSQR